VRSAGDAAAERAIETRLADGPADVVETAAALRAALPHFRGAEGALHALLHRLVREGRVVVVDRGPAGTARYAKPGAAAGTPSPPLDAPPGVPEGEARVAVRIASGARDAEAKGRIAADVLAHLGALPPATRARDFGSVKTAATLVRRVDRGRSAICLPASGGERFRRFVSQEGPPLVATLAVLALVWGFVVEPRVIPSSSMRPGLVPGDRVVVWKVGASSPPPRWSVVVFRRRADDLVLIKRVVGLPGEHVWVQNGEAYADGALLVKPDDVREAVRETLFDDTFGRLAEGATWTAGPRVGLWRFRAPLQAHLPVAPGEGVDFPDGETVQSERVHDLYVDAEFAAGSERDAGLWIEWVDLEGRPMNDVRCVAVRRTAGAGGSVRAGPSGAPGAPVDGASALAVPAASGGTRRLSLSVVDGVLRASAGGAEVSAPVHAPQGYARLFVEGDLRRLRVDRDLHYTSPPVAVHGLGPTRGVVLGQTELFLLGDHSSNSRDSRYHEVGPTDLSRVIGRAFFRVWPPLRIGPIR
jgi:signal peptidase I